MHVELYRIWHPQRTLDNDRMVLAVEERVEELIGLFEREAYRLAPLKGADVSGTLFTMHGQISIRISEICNAWFANKLVHLIVSQPPDFSMH